MTKLLKRYNLIKKKKKLRVLYRNKDTLTVFCKIN